MSEKYNFLLILRTASRNPYFYSVFGKSRSSFVKNTLFLKTSKNQGQKKKVRFRHICAFFGGPRNPYFCSVSKAPKRGGSIKLSWSDAGGVQLRTRKHIYIYISAATAWNAFVLFGGGGFFTLMPRHVLCRLNASPRTAMSIKEDLGLPMVDSGPASVLQRLLVAWVVCLEAISVLQKYNKIFKQLNDTYFDRHFRDPLEM